MKRICLKGGTVIAYDGKQHCLLPQGDVVVEDQKVVYVGSRYDGSAEEVISARGKLVIPGLINLHFHAGIDPAKYLYSDGGRPDFLGAHYLTPSMKRGARAPEVPPKLLERSLSLNLIEQLRRGVTTVVEMGGSQETVETLAALVGEQFGMNAYLGPGYKSASPYLDEQGRLRFEWDEAQGKEGLRRAEAFIETYHGAYDGRIQGMLFPMQADTSTDELLVFTQEAAAQLNVHVHTHAAQNLYEVVHTMDVYGKSPLTRLYELGFLQPNTILAHALHTGMHPESRFCGEDVHLLAESGAAVAHCPVNLSRRGAALYTFSQYRKMGIPVGLGTDIVHPHDLIREMRMASAVGKVLDAPYSATASEVFTAATLDAAAALGREDIGRLAPGSQADLAVIHLPFPHLGVIYDPLRTLVESADGTDVEMVMVRGKICVQEGRVLGFEKTALADWQVQCQQYADAFWTQFSECDPLGRQVEEVCPPSLPLWDEEIAGNTPEG